MLYEYELYQCKTFLNQFGRLNPKPIELPRVPRPENHQLVTLTFWNHLSAAIAKICAHMQKLIRHAACARSK